MTPCGSHDGCMACARIERTHLACPLQEPFRHGEAGWARTADVTWLMLCAPVAADVHHQTGLYGSLAAGRGPGSGHAAQTAPDRLSEGLLLLGDRSAVASTPFRYHHKSTCRHC